MEWQNEVWTYSWHYNDYIQKIKESEENVSNNRVELMYISLFIDDHFFLVQSEHLRILLTFSSQIYKKHIHT